MSDDEAGFDHNGCRVLYRKGLIWRAHAVGNVLTHLDLVHLSGRYTSDGRPTRGAWPRTRLPSDIVDRNITPVKGLPANCYNRQWLNTLTRDEVEALQMRDEIDLSISDDLDR